MGRYAVIFASHIPSIDKIWVGEEILNKIKESLPNDDIFVGINPSVCTEEWINIVKKYTNNYEITPDNLIINSDASSYQTALKLYKKNIKEYDLVWFLHTQGTKSGLHNIRNAHLNTLLTEKNNIIEIFKNNNEIGAYGTTLTPLPNCWADSDWDLYLERFGIKFKNRPIRCFLSGTMFVMRGNILNYFLNNCNKNFFDKVLNNPHTNGVGDPWFFERDFIHIVDAFNDYIIEAKYVINNYNINLNGLNDRVHYDKLLNEWKIKNKFNGK